MMPRIHKNYENAKIFVYVDCRRWTVPTCRCVLFSESGTMSGRLSHSPTYSLIASPSGMICKSELYPFDPRIEARGNPNRARIFVCIPRRAFTRTFD